MYCSIRRMYPIREEIEVRDLQNLQRYSDVDFTGL